MSSIKLKESKYFYKNINRNLNPSAWSSREIQLRSQMDRESDRQKEKCRRTNESIHDQLKCQDLLTGLSHLSYDEKCPFVVHLDSSKKNKMFPAPRLYSMYVYKAFQWL